MPVPIYTPNGWVDDDGSGTTGTLFTAARMNNIETGVAEVTRAVRSVRTAWTSNIQSGLAVISMDGVSLDQGDRVLLAGQANATLNGVYTYQGTNFVRAADFDSSAEIRAGQTVFVREGALHGGRTFVCQTDQPIIGTTAINFTTDATIAKAQAAADAANSRGAFENANGGSAVGIPNDNVFRDVLRADGQALGVAATYAVATAVSHRVRITGQVLVQTNADIWGVIGAAAVAHRLDDGARIGGVQSRTHSYGAADDTGRPSWWTIYVNQMFDLPAAIGTWTPRIAIACFGGLGGGNYSRDATWNTVSIDRVG